MVNRTCAAPRSLTESHAARGGADVDLATQTHIESCLRCQAELARYRRMLRALRPLRDALPRAVARACSPRRWRRSGRRGSATPSGRACRAAAWPTPAPSAALAVAAGAAAAVTVRRRAPRRRRPAAA